MFLTAAEVQRLTGYSRGSEQCRKLTTMGVPHYVRRDNKPVVVRTVYENWLNPSPPAMPERAPFVAPPLDAAAVYLPLNEIRSRKRKFIRGMVVPATGIYFLFRDDELLYIGLSNTLYWRLWTHFIKRVDWPSAAIWFNDVTTFDVPEYWRREVEHFYIDREQPPRNIRGIR